MRFSMVWLMLIQERITGKAVQILSCGCLSCWNLLWPLDSGFSEYANVYQCIEKLELMLHYSYIRKTDIFM